jgi:hypothetical protein
VDRWYQRVKIKSPAYIALHHAKDGLLNRRKIANIIRAGEAEEFATALEAFPEHAADFEALQEKHEGLVSQAAKVFPDLRSVADQKAYAAEVKKHGQLSGLLFALRKKAPANDGIETATREYLAGLSEPAYPLRWWGRNELQPSYPSTSREASLWLRTLVGRHARLGGAREGREDGDRADAWIPMVQAVWDWTWTIPEFRKIRAQHSPTLAIEWQTTYGGRASRGDTRDLLDLSAITGALCYAFGSARPTVYLPAEWKGQCPTDVIWGRCEKRLSAEEQAAITWPPAKSLRHNCYDAIGIGLKHLGRL